MTQTNLDYVSINSSSDLGGIHLKTKCPVIVIQNIVELPTLFSQIHY